MKGLNLFSKSLYLALFAAYGGPYALAALMKIISDCLSFLQPQLLRWLLSYVSSYQAARESPGEDTPNSLQGFLIAGLMFVTGVTQTIVMHQVNNILLILLN